MKLLDNNTGKRVFYDKLVSKKRSIDIVPYWRFSLGLLEGLQETFYTEWGMVRISGIVDGYQGFMHGYVIGHSIFKEYKNVRNMIDFIASKHRLRRIECTVEENRKGLEKVLELMEFEYEGYVKNSVIVNGKCVNGNRYSLIY